MLPNIKVSNETRLLVLNSTEWNMFLEKTVSCYLTSPTTPCVLAYQIIPPTDAARNLFEFGTVTLDAQSVVFFAQAGLIQWIQQVYGVGQEGNLTTNGNYDCATAQAMAVYARQLRASLMGLPPNQAPDLGDAFQMTALELQHLLSTSAVFQSYVMERARTMAPDAWSVLVPIPDRKYFPPPVPAECGFQQVYGKGSGGGGVGPVQPVALVEEEEQKKENNLFLLAGLGLGLVGAALFASTFMMKKA